MRFLSFFTLIFLFFHYAGAYFYPDSYLQSRDHFRSLRDKLKKTHQANLGEITLKVPSEANETLTIDGLHLQQEGTSPEKLVIVTSGIHGVEAFTGAAIQFEFIEKHLTKELLKTTGFLILHSLNPYGYHFHRRVDEDNVDLNRNLSATHSNFTSKSKDYMLMSSFLNPKYKTSASIFSDISLFIRTLVQLAFVGRKGVAQVVLGGQYQQPDGIYFGGQKNQLNAELIAQVFHQVGKSYKKIIHVDLHTGYGARGKLHFFTSNKASIAAGFNKIFSPEEIDLESDENFYSTSGDFSGLTMSVFKDKEIAIPMTFEFGTMDSQTIMGGFRSLRNMIRENQGHHHGYTNQYNENKTKKAFLDMFNPPDKNWRDKVVKEGAESLNKVTQRFIEL